MKSIAFILLLLLGCIACHNDAKNYTPDMPNKPASELAFDQEKWKTKKGKHYPFREKMMNDVLYSDSLRTLNKAGVLAMLGEPSYYRDNKDYLYYTIRQRRLGSWPLHTKSIVIKISPDDTVEWVKLYK